MVVSEFIQQVYSRSNQDKVLQALRLAGGVLPTGTADYIYMSGPERFIKTGLAGTCVLQIQGQILVSNY